MTAIKDDKAPPEAELSECCHATIGYDAWVDSNGEICGGPFDHNICINCGMEDPAVWGWEVPTSHPQPSHKKCLVH